MSAPVQVRLSQERILEGLNPAQLAAVTHGAGPQLVVAGAGTGKTAVITRRIAYLVTAKVCAAREILALTFTDKAAEAMESRVDVLVPYGFTDSTICTFHAFGERLLREHGVLLGMNPNYRVLSQTDQIIFLREHLFELPLKRLRPLSNPTQHLELLLNVISRAKDEAVSPPDYLDYCRQKSEHLGEDPAPAERAAWEKQQEIAQVYAVYQELMLKHGFVDFGDLLLRSLDLLRQHPDILADLRQRYRYLLVDEFQDTNVAQFELLRLLAGDEGNLTVVGDDDQSIYKFRGAALSNLLQFSRFYPESPIRVLVENYRSPQALLDAAYRLIRHNDPERLEVKHGLDKRLRSQQGQGTPVVHRHFDTVSAEADWVAEQVLEQRTRGRAWSDLAILCRTHRQADPFIRSLNLKGIPFRFSANQGLFQSPEVRLCTAFLRSLADPAAGLPLHQLASTDLYAFPAEDLARLSSRAKQQKRPLKDLLAQAVQQQDPGLSESARLIGARLLEDLKTFQDLARTLPTGKLLYQYLLRTGLLSRYAENETVEADQAIKNLAKFFQLVQRYEWLAQSDRVPHFVEYLDLLAEVGEDPPASELDPEVEAVQLMTVHRAKGLEFPMVFVVSLAANRFPGTNRQASLQFPLELAKEEVPTGDPFLAEERRLFYVAMTRAKEQLVLTSARDYGGQRQYKVSRFVPEALEQQPHAVPIVTRSAWEHIQHHAGTAPMPPVIPEGVQPLTGPISLSFSQLDAYSTCPLKYKYAHVLQVPVLPHHNILYGNALHLAVTEFYRKQMAQIPFAEDELIQTFLKSWVNEGFISREHEELRQQAGKNALVKFYKKETLSPLVPKYIEWAFNFTLEDYRIIGRIDRIDIGPDGKTSIIDFKSSEVLDQAEAEKKTKESKQLQVYALAWLKTEGQLPAQVSLYFLESGLIGSLAPDLDQMSKLEAWVLTMGQGIRNQEFEPKPDAWTCNYCAYRLICPHAVS